MRFSCDQCGRSYVASDEVAGRAFRMRCKQCGSEVVVRPPSTAPAPFATAPPAPEPARASSPAGGGPAGGKVSRRPTFDPFEGDALPDGDVAVTEDSLEILERTPPPRPIPRPPPPPSPQRTPSPPSPRAPPLPRSRPGRMLPAEDEAMLGPPGLEGRRSVPRWVMIVLAVGALAAGGLLFLR